jgi:chemotaxis protein histidine kinase CheA
MDISSDNTELKKPTQFSLQIPYTLTTVDAVEIRVTYAGSCGFFLNQIQFSAPKAR